MKVAGVHCFVLGHSNGGQVALRAALREPGKISGLVLSNPVLRVSVDVPPAKLKLARLLARYAPWVTLKGEPERRAPDPRPRDPGRASYRSASSQPDECAALLRHGRRRLDAHGASERVEDSGPLAAGRQDTVTDPAAARSFFDGIGSDDKTLSIYPKMMHEPLNEIGRQQVIDDVLRWLELRV